MGLFSRKDWNVIAITFESKQLYRVQGNRGQGKTADTIRDGVKKYARTIYWAVFDQKGAFLEGEAGPGEKQVPPEVIKKLVRELPMLASVRTVLGALEAGKTDKAVVNLEWNGYPIERRPG